MKETKIKEKITIAQNSNQSIANTVGAGLVSAQNKTNNKSTANVVGVGAIGDPQTKTISGKFIVNVVGADDPVRPLFEDQTQNKKSSKTYSNLISNI